MRQRQVLHQSLDDFIALQAKVLVPVLWQLDYNALRGMFDSYYFHPNILSAVVYGKTGEILAETGTLDGTAHDAALEGRQTLMVEKDGSIETLGTLVVSFHDRSLREALERRNRENLGIAFGLAVLIGLAITGVIRHLVSLPLMRLLASMERAAHERVREPVAWSSGDELGRVVVAYNAVLEREAEAQAKLQEYSDHLEEQVALRTAELVLDRNKLQAALQQLADREAYLQTIFETVGVGIAIIGDNGMICETNDYFLTFLDLGRDDVIGRNFVSFLHDQDGGIAGGQIQRVLTGKTSRFRMEGRFSRLRGDLRWAALSVAAVTDDTGKVVRLVSVVADITELKRAEQRFRVLLQSTPDPLVVTDTAGCITMVNRQAEELFGYASEEMLGQPVEMLVPDRMRARHADARSDFMIAPQDHPTEIMRELIALTRNGAEVAVEIALSPIETDQGIFVISALRDVTMKRKAVEDMERARVLAEQANRAKSEFLANMSHEIRTPMNAILGLLHLTLDSDPSPRQRGYLLKMRVAAQTLLGIINDVLDFSKIEAGKLVLDDADFALDDVFNAVFSSLAVKAEEKGLNFLFSLDPSLPKMLRGDKKHLTQILLNLAGNAVKFTQRGEIRIGCEVVDADEVTVRLRFAVADTGIGMSEEQLGRIFEAFSQADASITRRYGGTGLGLAISRHLVQLMNGDLTVTSRLEEGTTFTLSIPLGRSSQPEDTSDRGIFANLAVVVVSDMPAFSSIIAGYLKAFGCSVREVSPEGAVAEAVHQPCRLVVADYRDGRHDVVAAATALRDAFPPPVRPRILALGPDIADAGQVDAFVPHPVSPSALMNAIQGMFGGDRYKRHMVPVAVPAPQHFAGHVLLVEDNPMNQHVATELLAQAGVRVTVAGNGRECLALLETVRPDLILMDVQMPEMDGYTATRAIRQHDQWHRVPIVAMTANAMNSDRQMALSSGMNDHVSKPVDVAQLYAVLGRWLPRADAPPAPVPSGPDVAAPTGLVHFDAVLGMKYAGGNPVLYRQLLDRFRQEGDGKVAQIRKLLAGGDTDSAIRAVHSLKSTAKTVGAVAIGSMAAAIEQKWRAGRFDDQEAELAALSDALLPALEELADTVHETAPPAKPTATSWAEIAPAVQRLRRLVADYDADAPAAARELASAVATTPQAPVVRDLATALAAYDFATAAALLDRLEAHAQRRKPGEAEQRT